MRLSHDDENYGDSVSIETQRTILQQYVREHGFTVYDEYVDDGWSGTTFERPAFQRMMADVDAGKINCIITKDLSRFGREHVMMDYYLEFVFPEKRIRYIAVTDNEDTEKGLSDFVPFKNLFNEWLAKDTSRKVKAAYRAKYLAGEEPCTYAPLGYKKDPDTPNKLIVDEETSWIVKRIFELAAHGAGAAKITNTLYEEKVPTPGWIHFQREGGFANIYANAPPEKAYLWDLSQVKNILKNETYIGHGIHHRQGRISYKNRKVVKRPEKDWLRIENAHEAIISPEVFYRVQEQIASRKRKQGDSTTHIFAGLLRCADCGGSMCIGTNRTSTKTPYSYFSCTRHRQFCKTNIPCSAHYIRYDTLYQYILARIQDWSKLAQTDEKHLLQKLSNASDREHLKATKKQASELAQAEKRKAELDRLFAKMYEDWAAERITEYNFNMLSQKYQTEQVELTEKIEHLTEVLAQEKQTSENAKKWITLIKQYADPTELTADMLNTLIEKIVIHEATKAPDGGREQEIEIYYRFVGKID